MVPTNYRKQIIKLPAILTWKFRILLTQMLWMVIIWVVAYNIFIFIRFVGQPNATNPIDPNVGIGIMHYS